MTHEQFFEVDEAAGRPALGDIAKDLVTPNYNELGMTIFASSCRACGHPFVGATYQSARAALTAHLEWVTIVESVLA